MRLFEGMRAGDLKDLVLPLISVDEYESKVDASAVVFGFYVHDRDAANDLNRFLQKSPAAILDTEVSPAPDQHGYYLVFVEFLDNDRLARNVRTILTEMEPLVEISEWQMRVRKSDGLVPFSEEELIARLKHARAEDHSKSAEVLEFLVPSDLTGARLDEDRLILDGLGGRFTFHVAGFGPTEALLAEHGLVGKPVSLDLRDAALCNRLGLTLGEGWTASRIGKHIVVQRQHSDMSLVLAE